MGTYVQCCIATDRTGESVMSIMHSSVPRLVSRVKLMQLSITCPTTPITGWGGEISGGWNVTLLFVPCFELS